MINHFMAWREPVKYALKDEEFASYSDFILVREVHYTGTGWSMVGDEQGYFQEHEIRDIYLEGENVLPIAEMPENFTTFLCVVEYKGLIEHAAFTEGIESYEIKEWYPVYPVVRNRLLPQFWYPRNYMTQKDMLYY